MMRNAETGNSEWQERTFPAMGREEPLLPPGSKVRRLDIDTLTNIEYGERTWTTGQTARDILQNHLDAHTERFFQEIVGKVIDTKRLSSEKLSEAQLKSLDEFTYRLYLYRVGLGDRTPEAEKEMLDILDRYVPDLPIRSDMRSSEGGLKREELRSAVAPLRDHPPEIYYKVRDRLVPNDKEQWLSREELERVHNELLPDEAPARQSSKAERALELEAGFRFQITAVDVRDSGGGFDNTLTAFYKSTKTGKRHLRGKFGEGDKMSRTHVMRHGASMRSRSRYFINSGLNKERWWQHRPYVDPDDRKVKLKGAEIEMPKTGEDRFGSSTSVDLRAADQKFATEFAANLDPRLSNGLEVNCLDYSSEHYYYPMVGGVDALHPVGVSLTASPSLQYIQGLRVGEGQGDNLKRPAFFSYNFLDSSLLKGRDRNQFNTAIQKQLDGFWRHAESEDLLIELVKRVYKADTHEAKSTFHLEDGAISGLFMKFPDDQAQRTYQLLLEIIPKALDLESGKKYVIVSREAAKVKYNKLLPLIEHHGYTLLPLRIVNESIAEKNFLQKVTEHHQHSFELLNDAALEKEMKGWNLAEGLDQGQIETLRPVFADALTAFKKCLAILGEDSFEIPVTVEETPVFAASLDPSKEEVLEAEFVPGSGAFRIKLRPEIILGDVRSWVGIDSAYWRDRILVEMLSTVGRSEQFAEHSGALRHAQDVAQQLLDASTEDPEAAARLLGSFRYEEGEDRKYQDKFFEELKNSQEGLRAWGVLDRARAAKLSAAELEQLVAELPGLPPDYREKCVKELRDKIIIENDIVSYVSRIGDGYEVLSTPLDRLKTLKESDNDAIYFLPFDRRLFIKHDFPEGAVIEENGKKHIMFQNRIFTFSESSFGFHQPSLSELVLGAGTVSFTGYDPQSTIEGFRKLLSGMKLNLPDKGEIGTMQAPNGIVQTPLSVDYGRDEWDNPARVFEDIVQNHLDASPDGRITMRFEVQRGPSRSWITKEDLSPEDVITGFSVEDNGGGYPPNDIGTMGKSGKRHPLFAGKYGEGQKMVAAAAARKKLELTFASIASHEGSLRRWTGRAETMGQEIIVQGYPRTEERVVFAIESEPAGVEREFTSATTLRLPEGATAEDPEWQRWISVIDPRLKDERGYEGLGRYIIDLREGPQERVIDMGYMRVLLDEPGAIYENGLLVARTKDYAFGYDVPEVVLNRERNSFNSDKLASYIDHALSSCRDPRFAENVIKEFKDRYLSKGAKNFQGWKVVEKDLQFRGSIYLNDTPDSKPYWDRACSDQLPSYLFTSKDYLENLRVNGSPREKTLAQIMLANLVHIPEGSLVDVGSSFYPGIRRFFPTAESYVVAMMEQEVSVEEPVLDALRSVVADRASRVMRMLQEMEQGIETSREYQKLLNQNAREDSEALDTYPFNQDQLTRKGQSWVELGTSPLSSKAVFVSPANAEYLGTASGDRLGINETLFTPASIDRLIPTVDHELIHKITGLRDYIPEFIIFLLRMAQFNAEENT